jgi:hypothetical protein
MITINYLIRNKFPLDLALSDNDKVKLIEENEDVNPSYLCLLREMLQHRTTVRDLLRGWSGIQLVKID